MMTAMQRVLAALRFEEPDRVPLFLLATMHGAKELGLGIREYFSRPDYVAEGQMRLLDKFRSDCVCPSYYAALELEAFGAETIFIDDGPPNAGRFVIRRPEDIDRLEVPRIAGTDCLERGLETTRLLKERVGDSVPIVASLVSPFSLPVIQMGFERYIELMHEQPARFARLMAINQRFCIDWANAQVDAGVTAIAYVDPVASTTVIPRELFLRTGYPLMVDTLARVRCPAAVHLASGRGLPIASDLASTGAAAVAVSTLESLADWKAAVGDRLALIGNLNGLTMRHWSAADAEREVKNAIAVAGRGGGFILADNHGEIPWQVPDEVLHAIRAAVDKWGSYPLDWVEQEAP